MRQRLIIWCYLEVSSLSFVFISGACHPRSSDINEASADNGPVSSARQLCLKIANQENPVFTECVDARGQTPCSTCSSRRGHLWRSLGNFPPTLTYILLQKQVKLECEKSLVERCPGGVSGSFLKWLYIGSDSKVSPHHQGGVRGATRRPLSW